VPLTVTIFVVDVTILVVEVGAVDGYLPRYHLGGNVYHLGGRSGCR
jgi:hypothetical protein